MGSGVSAAKNNDELVDNLKDANLIKTSTVERVFRAVDRGEYFLHQNANPYKDVAWIRGRFHKSASAIYSKVMESLKLKSGLRFLNLGSGTGYLSTMAGLILGHNGINHGIELKDYVVQYANRKLKKFREFSGALDEFDFCEPKFIQGNCLCLASDGYLYDRVYCSASCPPQYLNYLKSLVKVGGILIVPVNDVLLKLTRTSETGWYMRRLLRALFATLVQPDQGSDEVVRLPAIKTLTLQELCRVKIRKLLKKSIEEQRPLVKQGPKLKRLKNGKTIKKKSKGSQNSPIPTRNDDNNRDSASHEPAQNLPTSDILSNTRSNVTSCNSRSNRIWAISENSSSEQDTSTDEDDYDKFDDEIAFRAYGQFRRDFEDESGPYANRPVWTDDSSDSDSEAAWDDLETSSETSETESVEVTSTALVAFSDSSDSDSEAAWTDLESSSEMSETESAESITRLIIGITSGPSSPNRVVLYSSSEMHETESIEATKTVMVASTSGLSFPKRVVLDSSSEMSETESVEGTRTRHATQKTKPRKAKKKQSSEMVAGVSRVTVETNKDYTKKTQSNDIIDESDNDIPDQMTAEDVSPEIPSSEDFEYITSDDEMEFVTKMFESAYSTHMVNRIRELPLPYDLKKYIDFYRKL